MNKVEYFQAVSLFRTMTNHKQENGFCCQVTRDDEPECCFQILDGAELTFTAKEVALVGIPMVKQRDDGMYVLDRSFWNPLRLRIGMFNGLLANTLECASHPTRPVVDKGVVVDVVVVDGCNARIGLESYRQNAEVLLGLWQLMVMDLGVKPYYGIPGGVKESWTSVVDMANITSVDLT